MDVFTDTYSFFFCLASMDICTFCFKLQIAGYSDKQHVLLKKLMEKITKFEVDRKRFDILKELVSSFITFHVFHQSYLYTCTLVSESKEDI